jgi:hypothetical protein
MTARPSAPDDEIRQTTFQLSVPPNPRPTSRLLPVRTWRGSDEGKDMPALDALTDLSRSAGSHVRDATQVVPWRRCCAGIVLALLVLLLASTAAALAWSFWVLASGALSGQGAILALVALMGSAVACSRYIGVGLVGSLILVGIGGALLFIGALFGVAGYHLILGS